MAMQVYAAALVHTAFRVAQGHIAQASGTQPEEISPAKFFPAWPQLLLIDVVRVAFIEIQKANPGSTCKSQTGTAVSLPGPPLSTFALSHATATKAPFL